MKYKTTLELFDDKMINELGLSLQSSECFSPETLFLFFNSKCMN